MGVPLLVFVGGDRAVPWPCCDGLLVEGLSDRVWYGLLCCWVGVGGLQGFGAWGGSGAGGLE